MLFFSGIHAVPWWRCVPNQPLRVQVTPEWEEDNVKKHLTIVVSLVLVSGCGFDSEIENPCERFPDQGLVECMASLVDSADMGSDTNDADSDAGVEDEPDAYVDADVGYADTRDADADAFDADAEVSDEQDMRTDLPDADVDADADARQADADADMRIDVEVGPDAIADLDLGSDPSPDAADLLPDRDTSHEPDALADLHDADAVPDLSSDPDVSHEPDAVADADATFDADIPCGDREEVCNGVDDNCNGQTDEEWELAGWYRRCDWDGDDVPITNVEISSGLRMTANFRSASFDGASAYCASVGGSVATIADLERTHIEGGSEGMCVDTFDELWSSFTCDLTWTNQERDSLQGVAYDPSTDLDHDILKTEVLIVRCVIE